MKLNQFKPLIMIVIVFWMAIIFKLSAQSGEQSNLLSGKVTSVIISLIRVIDADTSIMTLNYVIRKCAHFVAYLVLGIIALFAARRVGYDDRKGLGIALGICVSYAIADEIHQAFVPGRTPKLLDVLIDSSGAALGIGLYHLFIEDYWKKLVQKRM